MKSRNKQVGFTIVELLIVIVVIGILAAISVATYSGVRQKAEDARTRATAEQIVKAFQSWSLGSDIATSPGGYGSTVSYVDGVCRGGTGGWFSRLGTGYNCTVDQVLVDAGALPAGLSRSLPSANKVWPGGVGSVTNMMLYSCGSSNSGKWVFMYALHVPDTKEMTTIKTECAGGPTAAYGPIDSSGMTGGKIFSLPS